MNQEKENKQEMDSNVKRIKSGKKIYYKKY